MKSKRINWFIDEDILEWINKQCASEYFHTGTNPRQGKFISEFIRKHGIEKEKNKSGN